MCLKLSGGLSMSHCALLVRLKNLRVILVVKKNNSWTNQKQGVNQLFGFQITYLFLCWANMAERSGISMVKNNMSRSGPM